MSTTDTSERGLERLICTALTGHPCDPPQERRAAEPRPGYGRAGWSGGNPHDYDREFCVDRVQLAAFLTSTQPDAAESLALDEDGVRPPHLEASIEAVPEGLAAGGVRHPQD